VLALLAFASRLRLKLRRAGALYFARPVRPKPEGRRRIGSGWSQKNIFLALKKY